jgi:hypothetical protein
MSRELCSQFLGEDTCLFPIKDSNGQRVSGPDQSSNRMDPITGEEGRRCRAAQQGNPNDPLARGREELIRQFLETLATRQSTCKKPQIS